MAILIAVDLGYGFVKATNGDQGIMFSSCACRAGDRRPSSFGLGRPRSAVEDIRIEDASGSWFVGRKALATSDAPRRSLAETRHKDPFAALLLRAALALLTRDVDVEVDLITGLPPAWLAKSSELQDALLGQHVFNSSTNGHQRRHELKIRHVEVLPQALGAFWSQVLTPDGEIAATSRSDALQRGAVGVVDIGYKTTDLATIVDGDWVPERSTTLDFDGMSRLQALFAEGLRDEFGVGFSAGAVERAILTGRLGFGGMDHSVDNLLASVRAELAEQLLTELASAWQLHEYKQILVAGGGAHQLGPRLLEALPSAAIVEDPESANVRGYLAYGRQRVYAVDDDFAHLDEMTSDAGPADADPLGTLG